MNFEEIIYDCQGTCGGDGNGQPCKKQFTYKNKEYNEQCVKNRGGPDWCYVENIDSSDAALHWGYCDCKFFFFFT